jgi:hypothetical protein
MSVIASLMKKKLAPHISASRTSAAYPRLAW